MYLVFLLFLYFIHPSIYILFLVLAGPKCWVCENPVTEDQIEDRCRVEQCEVGQVIYVKFAWLLQEGVNIFCWKIR